MPERNEADGPLRFFADQVEIVKFGSHDMNREEQCC